ncbi:MAG: Mrp/NBP35 family ATP-binding protein [Bryobacteraceae bacterium]|jgi:Mrp family chromosome partitioning ATPase
MAVTSEQTPAKADPDSKQEEERRLHQRMEQIGRKLVVLSGKGGVGKSTVAPNLAAALAADHFKVGLLDVDIHGPSIPRLMGLEGTTLGTDGTSLLPVPVGENLAVMSIGFLLAKRTDAVIWRGPLKFGVIRQFLSDVAWGQLDFLVIDCPPGTGDEPLSVAQLVGQAALAVIVTTPQELAVSDVRRCITFCQQVGLPVAGIVENMSGFVCPQCGVSLNLFGRGGGEGLAREMGVPFLGCIPIDPGIVCGGDCGKPFATGASGPAKGAFSEVVRRIEESASEAAAGRRAGHCDSKGTACGHDQEPTHHCSCR